MPGARADKQQPTALPAGPLDGCPRVRLSVPALVPSCPALQPAATVPRVGPVGFRMSPCSGQASGHPPCNLRPTCKCSERGLRQGPTCHMHWTPACSYGLMGILWTAAAGPAGPFVCPLKGYCVLGQGWGRESAATMASSSAQQSVRCLGSPGCFLPASLWKRQGQDNNCPLVAHKETAAQRDQNP